MAPDQFSDNEFVINRVASELVADLISKQSDTD
jgi:hypothetical protein